MKRLLVYCEGPTEETFTKEILAHYFSSMDVYVTPIGAGGVSKYSILKKDLIRICKSDKTAVVTTMLDYYGLPGDTPGKASITGDIYHKAQHIEAAIAEDMAGLDNLYVNLTVHEFEGLLFSETSAFADVASSKQIIELQKINSRFETPEHINDSRDTIPSRRIKKIVPTYNKLTDGIKVAGNIGIDGISAKCIHFRQWIATLTTWAKA